MRLVRLLRKTLEAQLRYRDENQKNGQNSEQEQQKESKNDKDAEDAEQFLQKLRLGLVGWNVKGEI